MERVELISVMIKALPVFRTSINLTQEQLAFKLGISRQTVVSIENGKQKMSWTVFLALMFIFNEHIESRRLIDAYNLKF
jgi:DNA-binding XRE family transcriptional regulator